MSIGKLYQSGDWKGEKHVPVIHAPEAAKAGEEIGVRVVIGEEIPHPNVFEHHIVWVKVYFKPENSKFPVEVATHNFSAHGEYDVLTSFDLYTKFTVPSAGTIYATSYCNIHGLWENCAELKLEG